jgi:hypothetical protein
MLTERKSLRFDQCSSLEIILGQLVDIYGGSRNGISRATRLSGELLNARIRILEKRKELSCDLHSTISLYRPGVSLVESMEHVQEGFLAMLGRSDPYPGEPHLFAAARG